MKDIDQIFPREYVVAYSLNYAVFIASVVGLVGIGFPLAIVASTPGTVLAFIAAMCTMLGSSVLMCCGPQERGMHGKCQITAAAFFNALAALLHFIAVWLIIWAWDQVSKALGLATCETGVPDAECEAAIGALASTLGGLLWTTWLFVLFCTVLELYAVRVLLLARRAMEVAVVQHRQGAQQPPSVEAFPVVASSVVASAAPPPTYSQRDAPQQAPGVEMGAAPGYAEQRPPPRPFTPV